MGKRVIHKDPILNAIRRAWHRARNQARYRGEDWQLTELEFRELWLPVWQQRGRHSQDLTMSRVSYDQGWVPGNIEIITRREFLTRNQRLNGRIRGTPEYQPRKYRPRKVSV